jgi:hypothetical protein
MCGAASRARPPRRLARVRERRGGGEQAIKTCEASRPSVTADAARLLTWRAAWMARQGKPFARAEGSISKPAAGEAAAWVRGRRSRSSAGTGAPATTRSSAGTATRRSSPPSRAPADHRPRSHRPRRPLARPAAFPLGRQWEPERRADRDAACPAAPILNSAFCRGRYTSIAHDHPEIQQDRIAHRLERRRSAACDCSWSSGSYTICRIRSLMRTVRRKCTLSAQNPGYMRTERG